MTNYRRQVRCSRTISSEAAAALRECSVVRSTWPMRKTEIGWAGDGWVVIKAPPPAATRGLEWICHTFLLIFGERDPEKNQTKEGNKGNPVEPSNNLKKVGRLNRSTAETMVVRNRHTTLSTSNHQKENIRNSPQSRRGPRQKRSSAFRRGPLDSC